MSKKYAVFFNGYAPPGWVEIQADDDCKPRITDAKAAELAVKKGGMPGCDMLLHCDSGCMVRPEAESEDLINDLDKIGGSTKGSHLIYVIPARSKNSLSPSP